MRPGAVPPGLISSYGMVSASSKCKRLTAYVIRILQMFGAEVHAPIVWHVCHAMCRMSFII